MCRIFVRKSIYALFGYFTMILFVFQESGGFLSLKEAPLARKARGGGTYAAKTGHSATAAPLRGLSVRAANADCEEGPEDAPLGLLVSYGYFTA